MREPEGKCSEAKTEVYRDRYSGQLWFLVNGCHKISENFQISWAGYFSSLDEQRKLPFGPISGGSQFHKNHNTRADQKQTERG